jgi:hypothetical protein
MVALLLGIIACILLFGPIGLGVFAGIMICILSIYFTRMIVGYGRKHRRRDKVVVQTQRGKVTLLYKDGKWIPACRKPRTY